MRGRAMPAATLFCSSGDEHRELPNARTCYSPDPMKLVIAALLAALVMLQVRLWVSDEGMREVWQLAKAVESQRDENAVLVERNAQIKAEVADLKLGQTALEERARNDLGMISANETFYQVVDSSHRSVDSEPVEPATRQAWTNP